MTLWVCWHANIVDKSVPMVQTTVTSNEFKQACVLKCNVGCHFSFWYIMHATS